MNFAQSIKDARDSVAQIKRHQSWPSYKTQKLLGCDGWALRRDLKDAEEWLAWLLENAPQKQLAGVAVEGSGTPQSSADAGQPPFNSVDGTPDFEGEAK